MNLSKNVAVTLVKDTQVSAGSAVNSDSVDMQGWEGVVFLGKMTTAHASNFANLAQSSDDGSSDSFADLVGTKVTPGDSGDSWQIDVFRPLERYVRCEVDRGGANTITGEIYAIQYGPKVKPTTHGTTIDTETHVSPAEGTA